MAAHGTPLFDMAPRKRKPGLMSSQLQASLDARVRASLIDPDIWAAEIALARDIALDLDNPAPGTRTYALAEMRKVMLEVLDRLPRPEANTGSTSDLERVLDAITA